MEKILDSDFYFYLDFQKSRGGGFVNQKSTNNGHTCRSKHLVKSERVMDIFTRLKEWSTSFHISSKRLGQHLPVHVDLHLMKNSQQVKCYFDMKILILNRSPGNK